MINIKDYKKIETAYINKSGKNIKRIVYSNGIQLFIKYNNIMTEIKECSCGGTSFYMFKSKEK